MTTSRILCVFAATLIASTAGAPSASAGEPIDVPPCASPCPEPNPGPNPGPRLSLGLAAELETLGSSRIGLGLGLLGRVEFGGDVALEGEVTRVEHDQQRLDWSARGAVLIPVLRHGHLGAFALAGAGLTRSEQGEITRRKLVHGEVGAAVTYAITDTTDLTIDLRLEKRVVLDSSPRLMGQTALLIAPAQPEEENARRVRLGLIRRF